MISFVSPAGLDLIAGLDNSSFRSNNPWVLRASQTHRETPLPRRWTLGTPSPNETSSRVVYRRENILSPDRKEHTCAASFPEQSTPLNLPMERFTRPPEAARLPALAVPSTSTDFPRSRCMKRYLLPSAIMSLFVLSDCLPGARFNVSVKVEDEQGRPVPNALVMAGALITVEPAFEPPMNRPRTKARAMMGSDEKAPSAGIGTFHLSRLHFISASRHHNPGAIPCA